MTILTFSLSDLETGQGLALALVAPEARYASLACRGADRLDRRFARAAEWRAIEQAIALGLPAEPLDADHPIACLLRDPKHYVIVQYLAERPLDLTPATAAQALDAELRRQADAIADSVA